MNRAHAHISPSGAERIARCPGSPNATADLPRRGNEAAARGTVEHEITADCLIYGFDPYDYVGETHECDGFKISISAEDAEMIAIGVDWALEQPGRLFVETRVDLSQWSPFEFGTLDVGIVNDDEIVLCDHKYGFVPVDAESNKQVAIYAMGFYEQIARHLTKATRFRLIINQPRRIGTKWREWIVDLDDLREFMGDIQEAVAKATDPDAPRLAGRVQCQYCAANPAMGGPGCDALEAYMLNLMGLDRDALDDVDLLGVPVIMPDLSKLSPEQLVVLIEHRPMIKNWIDGLSRVANERARNGEAFPGKKLVKVKGDREYTDEAAAEVVLVDALGRDESFTKKLKSPAQAEKVLKPTKRKPGNPDAWAALNALIVRPDKEPELADLSDEREEYVPNEDRFDEEDVK